jgi:hypothetical protein
VPAQLLEERQPAAAGDLVPGGRGGGLHGA